MCLNNTWTISPCKTWEGWIICITWISVLLALGIIFFCTAEVWYISQGTAGHNLILVRFPFIFFDIFNSNKFCFGNSTRKHGLLFSAKKYWAIRFLNCFFWNIDIFVKIRYVEIKSCTVRLFILICLQNFPYHIQNNVSHKYLSTLINLLLCCLTVLCTTHSQSRQFWFCKCMYLETTLHLLSSHST